MNGKRWMAIAWWASALSIAGCGKSAETSTEAPAIARGETWEQIELSATPVRREATPTPAPTVEFAPTPVASPAGEGPAPRDVRFVARLVLDSPIRLSGSGEMPVENFLNLIVAASGERIEPVIEAEATGRPVTVERAEGSMRQVLEANLAPANLLWNLADTGELNVRLDGAAMARQEARELTARELLARPATIRTDGPVGMDRMLRELVLAAEGRLDFRLEGEAADVRIAADVKDRSIQSALEGILAPLGFAWSIEEENAIVLRRSLTRRVFDLDERQGEILKRLAERGPLGERLWGRDLPIPAGAEVALDEGGRWLRAVGSAEHVARAERFVQLLGQSALGEMEVRIYRKKIESDEMPHDWIESIGDDIGAPGGERPEIEDPRTAAPSVAIVGERVAIWGWPEGLDRMEAAFFERGYSAESPMGEAGGILNGMMFDDNFEEALGSASNRPLELAVFALAESVGGRAPSEESLRGAMAIAGDIDRLEDRDARSRLWFDSETGRLAMVDSPGRLNDAHRLLERRPETRLLLRSAERMSYPVEPSKAVALSKSLKMPLAELNPSVRMRGVVRVGPNRPADHAGLSVEWTSLDVKDPDDEGDDVLTLRLETAERAASVEMRVGERFHFDDYEVVLERARGETFAAVGVRFYPASMALAR